MITASIISDQYMSSNITHLASYERVSKYSVTSFIQMTRNIMRNVIIIVSNIKALNCKFNTNITNDYIIFINNMHTTISSTLRYYYTASIKFTYGPTGESR